jgi:PAS domain S-box-containing protein
MRPLLDSARQAMVLLSPEGLILLAGAAILDMAGVDGGRIAGIPFWQAPWWADAMGARVQIRKAVEHAAAGERTSQVVECRAADGTRVFDLSLSPIRPGPSDRPVFLLAEAHDITAHRQIAAAMQETAARHEAILASTLDPVVTIDAYGTIQSASRSLERVLGYAPEEVAGKNVKMLMPDPHQASHDGYLANYRATGITNILGRAREFEALRKDGSRVPIELSVARADIPGQSQPLFTGIIHDITERKLAERLVNEHAAALQRSNKDLEQFAYVASHDLQEPLRMIASFAGLLERRYKGKLDAEADEFIAYIVDGAQRMKLLIEDLLAYSRVSTKARAPEPIAAGPVAARAVADLRAAIDASSASVTVDPLPMVLADPTQIHQVFLNLIGNGLKFHSGQPPRVRVGAQRAPDQPGWWTFFVQDNGIGIDARHAERIFQIFERLHGHGDYPGTGIGLALCKKIIERHGGRIWVESTPGRGSSFRFTLPAAENHA